MGSGNVIARQLGVARNPREGVEELAAQLLAKIITHCCVIGCDTNNHPTTLFGATLGGFGLFGRVPKCLEAHHKIRPRFHRFSANLLGIERLTNVEYGLCLAGLCARAAVNPERLDTGLPPLDLETPLQLDLGPPDFEKLFWFPKLEKKLKFS